MTKAFVFGKFLPFHKGHQAMIQFALTQCDLLTVVVCCSDKEHLSDSIRCGWIKDAFAMERRVEVISFYYLEEELPNSSDSSETISQLWAMAFKKLLPDHALVVTSEPYGYFVAKYMNILHLPFDLTKEQFRVSASLIRKDLFGYWSFLPESVKPYYTVKIVLLGTESTGKTVLSGRLSDYYHCSCVGEAGRALIADSNSFEFEDLYKVAQAHCEGIEKAVAGNSPLVIIDTDIHITKSYSKFIFNKELVIDAKSYQTNQSDLYLYLNNDVTFIQDGTRLSELERNNLDLSHRQVLSEHKIKYVEIRGEWDSRFKTAIKCIDELLERKAQQFLQG